MPNTLRSPAEKALGLEPGEAYGADEFSDTDLGHVMVNGHKVELTQNEETSRVTAWVSGKGNVGFGYSKKEAVEAAREKLATASTIDSLYKRIAKVERVLRMAATLRVPVQATLFCSLHDPACDDIEIDTTIECVGWESFIEGLEQYCADQLSESSGTKVDSADIVLDDDLDVHGDSLLVRYLKAVKPANHEATGLFYDYLDDHYGKLRDMPKKFFHNSGFAGTPYVWEYYEDDSAFLNDYYDAYIDNEDLYNDDGSDKPDDETAKLIWDSIQVNDGDTYYAEDQLVSGDRLIIRHA